MNGQDEQEPQEIGLREQDPQRFQYEEQEHLGVLFWALNENVSDWPSYRRYIRKVYQRCLDLGLTRKDIKLVFVDIDLVRWVQHKLNDASDQVVFVQALQLLREMGARAKPFLGNWLEPLFNFLKQGPLEPQTMLLVKELLRIALREKDTFKKGELLAYLLEKAVQDPEALWHLISGKPTLVGIFRRMQAPPLLPHPLPGVTEILTLNEIQEQGYKMGLCLGEALPATMYFLETLRGQGRLFLLEVHKRFYLAWMRPDPAQGWRIAEVGGVKNRKAGKRAQRLAQLVCETLQKA